MMPNLTYLNVLWNVICEWNNDLSFMPQLEQLDLSYNCIQQLSGGIFKGLTKLQLLRLDGNLLAHIPDGLLHGLSSLTGVTLSKNKLSDLHPQSLAGLNKLEVFDISQNNFGKGITLILHSQLVALDMSNSSLTA